MAEHETAHQILEETLDVVDETLDVIEKVRPGHFNLNGSTRGQQIFLLTFVGGLGFVAGGSIAYFLTKRHFRLKMDQIEKDAVASAKAYYSQLQEVVEEPEASVEETLVEAATEAFNTYAPEDTMSQGEIDLIRKHNIDPRPPANTVVVVDDPRILTQDGNFNYADEIPRRTAQSPYIITESEYMLNEHEYEQAALTYFEGDDVLVDDRDQPIPNFEDTVGADNLTKFGYGSGNANIVFIRNESRGIEFEIERSSGSYTEEVLGFEHSDRQGARRFRRHDE